MTDDEMNENQDFAPEGEELADETSRISELESQVAQKDEALAKANARITELEPDRQRDERQGDSGLRAGKVRSQA